MSLWDSFFNYIMLSLYGFVVILIIAAYLWLRDVIPSAIRRYRYHNLPTEDDDLYGEH